MWLPNVSCLRLYVHNSLIPRPICRQEVVSKNIVYCTAFLNELGDYLVWIFADLLLQPKSWWMRQKFSQEIGSCEFYVLIFLATTMDRSSCLICGSQSCISFSPLLISRSSFYIIFRHLRNYWHTSGSVIDISLIKTASKN